MDVIEQPNIQNMTGYANFFPINDSFIGDNMDTYFKKWRFCFSYFINAPTGSGKSTFIFEKLIPFAAANKASVLVISNRLALDVQLKRQAIKTLFNNNAYLAMSEHEIIKMEEIPYNGIVVYIKTYQSVDRFLSCIIPSPDANTNPPAIGYVIMDEAHFFIADALFNNSTFYIYNRIVDTLASTIRVYMSATPDEVLPTIAELEYNKVKHIPQPTPNYHLKVNIFNMMDVFHFKSAFTNYNWIFFRDIADIVDKIIFDQSDDKWLIFVTSKELGNEIEKGLNDAKMDAKFIDAKSKSDKIWQMLVNMNCFKQKVLVSTNVIDNGINIIDPKLKHVVITTCDKVAMFQMIGRKRYSGELINGYIKSVNQAELNTYSRHREQIMKAINTYCSCYQGSHIALYNYWNNTKENEIDIRKLFRLVIGSPQVIELNQFASAKLFSQRLLYGDIIYYNNAYNYGDETDQGFPHLVMKWVGTPDAPITWLESESRERARQKLAEYVEQLIGTEMSGDEWSSFCTEFMELFGEFLPRGEWSKHKIRKNESDERRKANINKALTALKLPYQIKKEKKVFSIVPIEHPPESAQ